MIFIATTRLEGDKVEARYRLAMKSAGEKGATSGIQLAGTVAEAEEWIDRMAAGRDVTWHERLEPAAPWAKA